MAWDGQTREATRGAGYHTLAYVRRAKLALLLDFPYVGKVETKGGDIVDGMKSGKDAGHEILFDPKGDCQKELGILLAGIDILFDEEESFSGDIEKAWLVVEKGWDSVTPEQLDRLQTFIAKKLKKL